MMVWQKHPVDRQRIMMGVLDLGNITVEDIMLPHNEILGLDLSDSDTLLIKKIIQQIVFMQSYRCTKTYWII